MEAMDATSLVGEATRQKRIGNPGVSSCKKLCDLPDALLLRILELLPMEDAVRTSVLSRRWEYLWTSIPNLLLYENEFPNRTLFMNFVERALVCRDWSSLNAFSLSCSVQSDAPRINAWIAAVVRRNVQELDLELYDIEQPYVLPCCLFRCKTLAEFHLDMLDNLRIPSLVCFWSVKVLRLEQVNFVDNDYTGEMFSGPALQELHLTRCNWTALKVLKISAPNLLILNIGVCDEYDGRNCQVLINGARLTYFCYCGELFCDYNISGLDLLVEAYISVDMGSHPTVDQIHRGYKLLRKLSNVKKLTLMGEVIKWDLDEHNELQNTLPVFRNLTELDVGDGNVGLECRQLGVVLRRSPCLRSLEFQERMDVFFQTFDGILDPTPPCFLSSLKKITICSFYATDAEILAIRVLLRTAKALKELVIYCAESCSEDLVGDLRQRLVEISNLTGSCRTIRLTIKYRGVSSAGI